MTLKILRLDASARSDGVSRRLTQAAVDALGGTVVEHHLPGMDLPFVTGEFLAAAYTPGADRTPEQADRLAVSDRLVQELLDADLVVIGMPLYNFGVPAALKAWIDLVCRAGLTFTFADGRVQGLVPRKPVLIGGASGGTPLGSEHDHATPQLRSALAFLGLTDVTFVNATDPRGKPEAEALLREAEARMAEAAVAAFAVA